MPQYCQLVNCSEPAPFECSRCGEQYYCCKDHQKADWAEHKLRCNKDSGKGDPPMKFWMPPEYPPSRKRFKQSEMSAGPDQPMDPPERYGHVTEWWRDRTFVAPDGMKITASLYPPHIKESIQAGLRAKTLTWDYLCSDSFMDLITHATVRLKDVEIVLDNMRTAEVKPFAGRWIDSAIEQVIARAKGFPRADDPS